MTFRLLSILTIDHQSIKKHINMHIGMPNQLVSSELVELQTKPWIYVIAGFYVWPKAKVPNKAFHYGEAVGDLSRK